MFIDRGYGGQSTFTHQIATRAPASLTYRYELNRVEASDVYFCVNYGVCDAPTIGSLRSHQSLSPLALTALRRSIGRSPFSPTKGYVARLDMEQRLGVHGVGLSLQSVLLRRVRLRSSQPHQACLLGARAGGLRARAFHRYGQRGVASAQALLCRRSRTRCAGTPRISLGPRILTIPTTRVAQRATSLPAARAR